MTAPLIFWLTWCVHLFTCLEHNIWVVPAFCGSGSSESDEVIYIMLYVRHGDWDAAIAKLNINQTYYIHGTSSTTRQKSSRWEGKVYVDTYLQFGLQSAPLIFSALGDTLQCVLKHRGQAITWSATMSTDTCVT